VDAEAQGRYTLAVRALDAAGNVGRRTITVAASRARRGRASSPTAWVLTPVRR
jgi:hypothetical protein